MLPMANSVAAYKQTLLLLNSNKMQKLKLTVLSLAQAIYLSIPWP